MKDRQTGQSLKIELIEAPDESPFPPNASLRRYRVRVNGHAATKVPEATLTEVFNRLRTWVVSRSRRVVGAGPRGPQGEAGGAQQQHRGLKHRR